MQCISCKVEILSAFKHAVSKNECPACGGQILDEESLALIEDVERTISAEVSLREGTANKLAVTLVTRYDMAMKSDSVTITKTKRQDAVKVAPPSMMRQVVADESIIQSADANIVKMADFPETISDAERDRIMAEVVSKRYGMVDGITTSDSGFEEDVSGLVDPSTIAASSIFTEGATIPVLEKERLLRLAKQQQALKSGSGFFRR